MRYLTLLVLAALAAVNLSIARAEPTDCIQDGDRIVCCNLTFFDAGFGFAGSNGGPLSSNGVQADLVQLESWAPGDYFNISDPELRVRLRGVCNGVAETSGFSTDNNCGDSCERASHRFPCVPTNIRCAVSRQ